ncbi:MAG: putative tRNA/rRNA methyltransferase [Alphaproteobacteria bacterium MarineAlpha5_Bin6]|nr:MAG: putative tRNA/rRNA methyltransferase [Alphaproteobacteria bacterium MarineAlpha5_Bin7]PPR53994.1 MAG: putative tRNA/rRNA methyltransferase [Alphaproteobacteria bacterium MarineAlpha5_Bin6]
MKNKPTIVLVRPQLPENIGLSARAMENCDLNNLFLVSPREKWPNKISIQSSANSSKIIKKAKVFNNLDNALSSFHYVVATSNRKRFLNKPQINNFDELFKKIPKNKKIAIIFGPENSGLSNEDLMLADLILNINLSNSNRSLNLSHAVLLFSYKWYEYFNSQKSNSNLKSEFENIASKEEFNFFMNYLKKELDESGFLYPKQKSVKMFNNIKTIFLRSSLSKIEIKTLWGMLKKLSKKRKLNS